eukprot:764820-Hanusia_phi.AAC.4
MDPYDGRAWVGLAKLYEHKNQLFKVTSPPAFLSGALSLLPSSASPPPPLLALPLLVVLILGMPFLQAKDTLQSGLQKLPRSPFLLQALGCIEQKQVGDRRKIRNEGRRRGEEKEERVVGEGCGREVMRITQGQLVEALKLFQRAVEEDETHAASWVSLGKLEERMKRSWRARQCYAKVADPSAAAPSPC